MSDTSVTLPQSEISSVGHVMGWALAWAVGGPGP